MPPDLPLTGEEPKLRALRAMREGPKSPQPPMPAHVRWARVFRELMYAMGQWNRPGYTRALDIAVPSNAREEEQEPPGGWSAATHQEVDHYSCVARAHDVGELAEGLAEALGIEVTSYG